MADRTLLQMVNSVRYKLRLGDPLTTLPTSDAETETLVGFINEAAKDILEGRDWSFDRREGQVWTTKRLTGTAFTFSLGAGFTSRTASIEMTEASELATVFEIAGGLRKSRIVVSDGTTPNIAYAINSAVAGVARVTLVLDFSYLGGAVAAAGTWTIYSHEYLLSTSLAQISADETGFVRKVLSVRDQDQPLRLEFIERDIAYDQLVPRPHDTFSDQIEVAYVLPRISNTSTTDAVIGAASTELLGLLVWPVPTTARVLQYTYMFGHDELAAATPTGTFPRVPANVSHLIEWRAVQMAYASSEKDPAQLSAASRMVGEKMAAAIKSDERAPSKRYIPTSFGGGGHGGYRQRWATQEITNP